MEILPILTPQPNATLPYRQLRATDPESLVSAANELTALLAESVGDFGLEAVKGKEPTEQSVVQDDLLLGRRPDGWVISPRLKWANERLWLTMVVAAPGEKVLRYRSSSFEFGQLSLRASTMLRDLLSQSNSTVVRTITVPLPPAEAPAQERSQGKGALILNGALLGGWIGYSLQEASGSEDIRLKYPLIALGSGLGLGGAVLVADEWDIQSGDAWFVSGAAWWPALSAALIATHRDVAHADRHLYGLLGGGLGIGAAATALSFTHMSTGDALLVHSGGGAGLILGGVTQMALRGSTDFTPYLGMGWGAGVGAVTGGVLALQSEAPASRILYIDLTAALGALIGAAAATPLLLVDDPPSSTRERLWLSSIGLGTLVGGFTGWWLSSDEQPREDTTPRSRWRPSVGAVAVGHDPRSGERDAAYGLSLHATW